MDEKNTRQNQTRFDPIRFTLIHFQNEMFVIHLFSLLLLLSRPVSTNLRHECRRKAILWFGSLSLFLFERLKFKYIFLLGAVIVGIVVIGSISCGCDFSILDSIKYLPIRIAFDYGTHYQHDRWC